MTVADVSRDSVVAASTDVAASTRGPTRQTFLMVSQVYVPDPASVGQHMAGAAAEIASRGHRVVVLTAAKGYDDPSVRYAASEHRDGVEIRRLPFASFGKRSILSRVSGGLAFVAQVIVHALFMKHLDAIVVTTAPPFAGLAAVVIGWFRRVRVHYWVMDLSPDIAIATGQASASSLPVRCFNWLNRRILSSATTVTVLDRFMRERVIAKLPSVRNKLQVLPPWPHEDVTTPLPHVDNTFRRDHGLQDKFVVMYSGNHSLANPLDTLLAAAARLEHRESLVFVFVGGGVGKRQIDSSTLHNICSLPYQPLGTLRQLLSAADVHVVSIGEGVVGMVHPCKVYGAMAVARPIILFGPEENHVTDLLNQDAFGWHLRHGDVDGTVTAIENMIAMPAEQLHSMGLRAQQTVSDRLSRTALTNAVCNVFEERRMVRA